MVHGNEWAAHKTAMLTSSLAQDDLTRPAAAVPAAAATKQEQPAGSTLSRMFRSMLGGGSTDTAAASSAAAASVSGATHAGSSLNNTNKNASLANGAACVLDVWSVCQQ